MFCWSWNLIMTTKEIRRRTRRTATAQPVPSTSEGRRTNQLIDELQLAISYVDPTTLKPPRRELRKNSSRQADAIAASIRNFGFLSPILVDGEDRIICGHARWQAAKELGLNEVPVISATHLSDVQIRLVALADNKCSSLGEWDEVELGLEFAELGELVMNTETSLELSAFSSCEIDQFPRTSNDPTGERNDDTTPAPAVRVTQSGDLWQLGHHRLLCGDALAEQSYQTLMGSEPAQMVFVDPPYNLSARTISGLGKVKHGNFRMGSGELSSAQFTEFLTTAFGHMARYSIDGAMQFACMDWRHTREMQDAGEAVYSELKNIVVWDKQKGGMGACYRSQHEFIWVWKNGTSKHINNFGLGEGGRYRTNVWSYKGNNSFHRNRAKELATHATVKPLALVADAIRDCSALDRGRQTKAPG